MELKFSAQVNLSELEVRRIIEAEIIRRHPGVKVTNVNYNVWQNHVFNGGVVGAGNIVGVSHQPCNFSGITATVEKV